MMMSKNLPIDLRSLKLWFTGMERRLSRLERPTLGPASPLLVGSWTYAGSTEVPFENGWVNFASTVWEPVAFRRDADGNVWVRGMAKNGTISTTLPMFTLPEGYRPLLRQAFPSITGGDTVGRFTVHPDGHVVPDVGNNAYFSLNCVFQAGQ